MKHTSYLPTVTALLRERLSALGVSHLPERAMRQIEADTLNACRRAISHTITGPRIGRAMAAALAAPAAGTQGRKGADAPLPSSFTAITRESVAGRSYYPQDHVPNDRAPEVAKETEGDQL